MRSLIQFTIGIALTIVAGAAPEMTLKWSKLNCLPGDVVELRVRVSSNYVTGFDLKLPDNDALEWVEHDRGPLLYQAGIFTQEDVLIGQPTRAGTIQLKDLHAIVRDGETKTDSILTVQPLTVGTYGVAEESFSPAPLPVTTIAGKTSRWTALWIGLSFLVLALLVYVFRKKPQEAVALPEPPTLLGEVAELLENEDGVVEPTERLLDQRSQEFSDELREALERFVYGRSGDLDGLRELLGKETKR